MKKQTKQNKHYILKIVLAILTLWIVNNFVEISYATKALKEQKAERKIECIAAAQQTAEIQRTRTCAVLSGRICLLDFKTEELLKTVNQHNLDACNE